VRFAELIALFGCAERALDDGEFSAADVERARAQADAAMVRAEAAGARVIAHCDADYPVSLRELHDPPPVLFARGDLAAIAPPAVAIVGTRRATNYGERITREIATALARAGVSVLSGMARGIDGTAHRAALAAGGRTAAVLGTGVDLVYPTQHRALHAQIGARGLLLSEELPGDRANGGSFPKRNRVLAALAQATIVIEAPRRSGALITAGHALELGRAVAAVPGPIDAPACVGSNLLLRDGAVVLAEVSDALTLFGIKDPARPRELVLATRVERAVWDALGDGAAYIDDLCARAGLPARECMGAVSSLEVAGAIECALTGEIRRR
jgi:DNA processing protein